MRTTGFSDRELLALAGGGDESAFTELRVRHRTAAQRLAAAYPDAGDPQALVAAAFERILAALHGGAGPSEAFRTYLFVTLRRLVADHTNRSNSGRVDALPGPVRAEELSPPLDPAERRRVTEAFESLSERMQVVLWQAEVEGRESRELAASLGLSDNAAVALAYRAMEKFRRAYMQAHLDAAPSSRCDDHRSRLTDYLQEGLSSRDRHATDAHLDGCDSCRSVVAALVDIGRSLCRALLVVFEEVTATPIPPGTVGHGAPAGDGLVGGAMVMVRRLISMLRDRADRRGRGRGERPAT